MHDQAVQKLIRKETARQKRAVNLIASENCVSKEVLTALGSSFTNKYAEGYPGKRYYGGNEIVDKLENLVKARALKLFKLSSKKWSVNVQPLSGSPANLAAYLALVPLGGKIMSMSLNMGGHLTHGSPVSATGKLWRWAHYGVDKKTEKLNYNEILKTARQEKPKLVVCGFTAYSRAIDFKKFRGIAEVAGARLLVDMSHLAGLVAGNAHPSPFPYADVVTTTTQKTLRGPRAALIFSRIELASAIDRAVFPGLQGGPHLNTIAAVAVALKEASTPVFRRYAKQVVENSQMLANTLAHLGWRIVSGGTDTHLFLIDTMAQGVSGKTASEKLERAGIIVNKNMLPFDTRRPADPSGIRIGTAAMTTRGMQEDAMKKLARRIDRTLRA